MILATSSYATLGARLLTTSNSSLFEATYNSTSLISNVKAPPIEWSHIYAGQPQDYYGSVATFHDAISTSDGGYALVGLTAVNGGAYFWLVRTDANGNTLWNKTYGNGNSEAFSVVQASDGGFVIAGVDNNHGFVVRTDPSGNQYTYMNYTSGDGFYSIAKTLDGNYVVAGRARTGIIITSLDFYLVKLDNLLSYMWDHTYGAGGDDTAYCVIQASDGGYVLVGTTTNGDSGSTDGWLVKTDSSGNTGTGWNQQYGGKGNDEFYSVIEIRTGEYLVGGKTGSFGPQTISNPWLVDCRQPNPPIRDWRIWDVAYDDGTTISAVFGIVKNDNGGYVLALADCLAGVDSTGNVIWVRRLNTEGDYYLGSSVIKNTDGSYSFASRELWVDGDESVFSLTKVDIEPVTISSLSATPTVPGALEPVEISVSMFGNRTHANVDTALLFYNDGTEWWNTTMKFNSTIGRWTSIIPGLPTYTTVSYYVEGWIGPSSETSTTRTYTTSAPGPAVLRVVGSPSVGPVGITFVVNVSIENLIGFAGLSFDLDWNPLILQAVNMTEVLFHTVTPTAFWSNMWNLKLSFNNTAGKAQYAQTWQDTAQAQLDGYAPANVTSPIVTCMFVFNIVAQGTTNLTLSNVKIGDLAANPIPCTVISSSVIVNQPISIFTVYVTHEWTKPHNFTVYTVLVESNCSGIALSGFDNSSDRFYFMPSAAWNAFYNITLPKTLLAGALKVVVNGTILPSTVTWNATHYFICFYWPSVDLFEIFGERGLSILGDLNDDGIVDIFDAILLAAHFGQIT